MRRRLAILAAMLLFSGGLVGAMGGVAWAATPNCSIPVGYECSYSTTGSTVHVYNEGSGYLGIQVCDTKADGDSAYDWYNIGSSTHQPTNRQETSGGNGTCTAEILYSTTEITTEACRDISGNPDNCSGWVHMIRS
jgi:hypothetical protein